MRSKSLALFLAGVAGVLFTAPLPASAGLTTCPDTGAICIDESVEGQTPTLTGPPGVTFTITPVPVAVGEEWAITVFAPTSFSITTAVGSSVGLLEPGTLLPSDVLIPTNQGFTTPTLAFFSLSLFSDNELGQIGTTFCSRCTLIEDGTFQELEIAVSTDLLPTTSFYLKSDGEVPEPASLALLGTALVGFGVMRRRRRLRS